MKPPMEPPMEPPMVGGDAELPAAQPLTPRETEILNCLGNEMSNRQIAEHLVVSLNTVKWYVRQIYNKLGVNNRVEAVALARSLGLLAEEESAIGDNLPAAATPFVGRAGELDSLAKLIADPQVRLITIVGPGGIGKTRLAQETAARHLRLGSQFRDGIFFVSLAPLRSGDEIVSTLAATLDFQFQGAGSETEQLLNYLRNKQMLLVMDNFEHILDGRVLLAEINERAAGITLLVTSRERLQLHSEQLFPLGGLELPQTANSAEVAPAAELFLNIARRTAPDFQLLEGDAQQLLQICRLIEGMPLGLELAASWVGLLPLSKIAAEIESNLDLLASEQQDVPQRHQSMQATLDISWRRLNRQQQSAFQELTVFRGGFTRAAAREVAGAALPLLVTLANKSWLSYDRQRDRYHIHELLRQYGAAKLGANAAQEQEVRQRHSAYFCGYLQEREADWHGPRQKEAAAEVRSDIDNIQSAWRRAAGQGESLLLAQGLSTLCHYYFWDGRLKDGRQACRLAGDGLSKSIAGQEAGDAQCLALWSQVLAWEIEFVNDVAQKEELLARSQDILDRVPPAGLDTRAEQAFILLKGTYAEENKDLAQAIHLGTQGLELYRELGVRWGEAELLGKLGDCYISQGAQELGNDHLRESLEISQQLGDTQGIAQTMLHLGISAQGRGDFEEAEALHRQGLDLFRQLETRRNERIGQTVLSFTLSWAGKFLSAAEAAERATALSRDLGQYPNPHTLVPLTKANLHLGRYSETKALGIEGLETARQIGRLTLLGVSLSLMGYLALVEGDFEGAKRYLLESATVFSELGHNNQAVPQAVLSYVFRAEGDNESATRYVAGALRTGVESGFILPVIYSLPAAALLAADEGNHEKAVELYGVAQQFDHIRNSHWFADVAGNELDGARAALPPDAASAAEARGREMDVWQTVESLLQEINSR